MDSVEYREKYLQSNHWAFAREHFLNRANHHCERCGASGVELNLHHLNYENLWNEAEEDIIVLCKPCHEEQHGVLPNIVGETGFYCGECGKQTYHNVTEAGNTESYTCQICGSKRSYTIR